MHRAVVAMVVTRPFQMLGLMREVIGLSRRQPATLHGQAMQGQQHQQENADNPAHGDMESKQVGGL